MFPETDDPRHTKALTAYDRLLRVYGKRPLKPRREPMHELISTMLSHRTTEKNEALAFKRMWTRFGSWEAIRDAPLEELIAAVTPATFAENKAPRIQEALGRIIEEQGEPSIKFLRDMPTEAALAWLMDLPGVGIKTASLVLLFCFNHPVLPVDTHVHRTSQRLGLIGQKVGPTAAHAKLLAMLPKEAELLYNFHVSFLRHGQRVCVWGTPRCERCPLTELCDWYAENRAG